MLFSLLVSLFLILINPLFAIAARSFMETPGLLTLNCRWHSMHFDEEIAIIFCAVCIFCCALRFLEYYSHLMCSCAMLKALPTLL